mmetsp:Transcript_6856/g.20207  ORF Transcript_6856/g.20207 Transcript_6856/m.20207 type:complete len:402 (-) Transcript_6856:7-1212(-)
MLLVLAAVQVHHSGVRIQHIVASNKRVDGPVAQLRVARRVTATRCQVRECPGVVESGPPFDSISKSREARVRICQQLAKDLPLRLTSLRVSSPPGQLAWRVQQSLRQVPVVQCHVGRYAGRQQLVDQPAVERHSFSVDPIGGPACWEEPRPCDAEAVVPEAHGLHQRDVCINHVVVVRCHVASRAPGLHAMADSAGLPFAAVAAVGPRHVHGVCACEGVPDGSAATTFAVPTFHLVGSRGDTPRKPLREGSVVLVLLRPLPELVRDGVHVRATLQFEAPLGGGQLNLRKCLRCTRPLPQVRHMRMRRQLFHSVGPANQDGRDQGEHCDSRAHGPGDDLPSRPPAHLRRNGRDLAIRAAALGRLPGLVERDGAPGGAAGARLHGPAPGLPAPLRPAAPPCGP